VHIEQRSDDDGTIEVGRKVDISAVDVFCVYFYVRLGFVRGEWNCRLWRRGIPTGLPGYLRWSWRCNCHVHENESGFSLLRPDEITEVSGPPSVPVVTLLEQNAPNPFNPTTVIRFSIAEPGWVRLVVYDVGGRPVRVLVDGERQANRYEVTWDGRDSAGRLVASGVYLYCLEAADYSGSKKMVLLK
jgi:hypothetical protein